MKKYNFYTKPRKPLKRTPLKSKKVFSRKSKLRIEGHSTSSQQKRDIQALVRFIVCYRDGGCVLRDLRNCGGEAVVEGEKIISNRTIQADHILTRANSATFADTRLIVCICSGCHMWKKYHENEYNDLIRKEVFTPAQNILWDKAEKFRQAHKTYKPDWAMELVALRKELLLYEKN
jgi:hypothetical protein